MNIALFGIVAYFPAQLLIGIPVSKHISTENDYPRADCGSAFNGGTFTVFATWFRTETCIGAAESTYQPGLCGGSADGFSHAACLFPMRPFCTVPLWQRKLKTLIDPFRFRYSPKVERLAALMLLPPSMLWAAAEIRAFGRDLFAAPDLEVEIALTIAAAVVILSVVYSGLPVGMMPWLVSRYGLALTTPYLVAQAASLIACFFTAAWANRAVNTAAQASF